MLIFFSSFDEMCVYNLSYEITWSYLDDASLCALFLLGELEPIINSQTNKLYASSSYKLKWHSKNKLTFDDDRQQIRHW